MNKLFFTFIYLCLIASPLKILAHTANTVEFRTAAFWHQNKKFRHVYNNVNADYQLVSTFALNRCFEIWGEVDYSTNSKKKECYHTRIQLTNFGFGLQYVHCFCSNLNAYIGTGVSLECIHLKNRSCCGYDKYSKISWGSLSRIGARYWFTHRFFLDIFADYLYQEVHISKSINLSGFKTGIGIGVGF